MGFPHFTRWPNVEGYCGRRSYVAGDMVDLHCAGRTDSFTVEVARIGARREVVFAAAGVRASDHDVPDDASESGCDWPITAQIRTDEAWPSGFYEVRLVDEHDSGRRDKAEAFFVLKAPVDRRGRILLVLSTNTYNAYNQWGGTCLYSGAHRVSFLRPLERGYLRRPSAPDEVDFDGRITDTDGDPTHRRLLRYLADNDYPVWCDSSGWHNWERRFVRWAETAGHQLDYAVNEDLHHDRSVLDGYALMLSVGHDEYWSWEMRDAVDAFVERGGNWAIFSGNTCAWQVRFDGDTMVSYKSDARRLDPVRDTARGHLLTSWWADPLIGRPETQTTGLTFSRGGYHRVGRALPDGDGSYTVHQPDHWAFAGLGLQAGDRFGGDNFAVGYEVDGCDLEWEGVKPRATLLDGAPDDIQLIATAPAKLMSITADHCEAPAGLWASLEPPGDIEELATVLYGNDGPESTARLARGHAVMAEFTRGRGRVLNVGSADWAHGLDTDPVVQYVTNTILETMTGR